MKTRSGRVLMNVTPTRLKGSKKYSKDFVPTVCSRGKGPVQYSGKNRSKSK